MSLEAKRIIRIISRVAEQDGLTQGDYIRRNVFLSLALGRGDFHPREPFVLLEVVDDVNNPQVIFHGSRQTKEDRDILAGRIASKRIDAGKLAPDFVNVTATYSQKPLDGKRMVTPLIHKQLLLKYKWVRRVV